MQTGGNPEHRRFWAKRSFIDTQASCGECLSTKTPQGVSYWKDHGHHVSDWLLGVHALDPCLRRGDDEELGEVMTDNQEVRIP